MQEVTVGEVVLVLFDIDDVFNAPSNGSSNAIVNFDGADKPASRFFNSALTGDIEIRVPSAEISTRIRRLEAVENVECIGASTGENPAGSHYAPHAGFGSDWEHVPFSLVRPKFSESAIGWKYQGITRWLHTRGQLDEPLVFADDANNHHQTFFHYDHKNATTINRPPTAATLRLIIDPVTGITGGDLDQIESFVRSS